MYGSVLLTPPPRLRTLRSSNFRASSSEGAASSTASSSSLYFSSIAFDRRYRSFVLYASLREEGEGEGGDRLTPPPRRAS